MHARGAVWCFAQGPTTGGGCARTWGGPTRARTRVARGGFDSADTHEAVELPAGVAALHTALAKVDRDNLTHFVFVLLTLTLDWMRTATGSKSFWRFWPIHLSSPTKPPTKRHETSYPRTVQLYARESRPCPPSGTRGCFPTVCFTHGVLAISNCSTCRKGTKLQPSFKNIVMLHGLEGILVSVIASGPPVLCRHRTPRRPRDLPQSKSVPTE